MYTLILLAACIFGGPPKDSDLLIGCTDIAMASVVVNVEDLDGQPVEGAVVTWSVDGGEVQEAVCDIAPCSTFVLGYEQAGAYHVEVSYSADTTDPYCWYSAYDTKDVTVEMDFSGCHVEGETITFSLDTTAIVCE
jgi:hypothetical protein